MDLLGEQFAENVTALHKTLDETKAYAEVVSPIELFSDEEIAGFVGAEMAQGAVMLDGEGLTTGLKDRVFPRVREYQHKFAEVCKAFEVKYEHFARMEKELEAIPGKIAEREQTRDAALAQAKQEYLNDPIYVRYAGVKAIFDDRRRRLGREPNLASVSPRLIIVPFYWIGLSLLGIAEYFINFDTINSFLGIPALAMAATIVFGVVFAGAAHIHGTFMKQWKQKFVVALKEDRPWFWLGFATAALLFLLNLVGWFRYEWIISITSQDAGSNLLGNVQTVSVSPVFEVVLTLGGNIAAWIAGVMFAYFCHDVDEEYVRAAVAERKFKAQYLKVKDAYEENVAHIKLRCAEDVTSQNNIKAAIENDQSFRSALTMRGQFKTYDNAIIQRIKTYVALHMTRYKSQLLKVLGQNPQVQLYKSANNAMQLVPASDYQTTLMSISDEVVGKYAGQGIN